MQVLSIDFDDEGAPSSVTARLTRHEAEVVTKLLGRESGNSLDEKGLPAGKYQDPLQDVYYGLTGMVFNRYWDDGIDDAIRENEVNL